MRLAILVMLVITGCSLLLDGQVGSALIAWLLAALMTVPRRTWRGE